MTHSQQCGKRAFEKAKKRYGTGWPMLSAAMQQAAVSQELMDFLFAQHLSNEDPDSSYRSVYEHVMEASRYAYELAG